MVPPILADHLFISPDEYKYRQARTLVLMMSRPLCRLSTDKSSLSLSLSPMNEHRVDSIYDYVLAATKGCAFTHALSKLLTAKEAFAESRNRQAMGGKPSLQLELLAVFLLVIDSTA